VSDERYIWVNRWNDFQHYKPDPKRGPAWIKNHTSQLHDERYLRLTDRQRSLLHDVRMLFATFRGRLSYSTPTLARQRGLQTRDADVKALVAAGFILILSREGLDQALEHFYKRSRAEVEVEKEEEKTPNPNPAVDVAENGAHSLPELDLILKDMPL
jgi:hypothetical protein